MSVRAQQREQTRARILESALTVFSNRGFAAAGTREIAQRAGVNQGLIRYHFKTKANLWREAATLIFTEAREHIADRVLSNPDPDVKRLQRNLVKAYVSFVARRPELIRFMVEEGKQPSARVRWLVDTHLKPLYERFPLGQEHAASLKPHFFYAMTGAAALIFSVRPVCKRLTGLDPIEPDVIDAHADFVARLLVP
jgi:TetR/AcrR family transcriptional regulator